MMIELPMGNFGVIMFLFGFFTALGLLWIIGRIGD
jgi:hypothetical protein